MSELVKNLIKRFEYNRKHKKNYLLVLLVMAVLMAGGVTWGLKLTGVSVTAEDTEVAEALETYGLLQGASAEESTQETESTEVSQKKNQQETTEVSTEQTEDTEAVVEDEKFQLDTETVDGITVTVSGDSSFLPYPADEMEVRAEEVTDVDVVSLCDQLMEENEVNADKQYLLSLSLYHGEEEVEPTGNVTVTFSGLDTENYEPSVYSINTETEDAEDMDAEADKDGNVAVDAEQVSYYGIMLTASDTSGFTEIASDTNISTLGLSGRKWILKGNAHTHSTVVIDADTTIDLNGHGIYYDGTGDAAKSNCFQVDNGTLTIMDSGNKNITSTENIARKPDKTAYDGKVTFTGKDEDTPSTLTYYVTDSSADTDHSTVESITKYEVTGFGYIVGKGNGAEPASAIVWVNKNGKLDLQGGMLTAINNDKVAWTHIVANDGTMNMQGGYICDGKGLGDGGGVKTTGSFTMSGGVITANYGSRGGGVFVNGGSFTMKDGIITGNGTKGTETKLSVSGYMRGLGGGIFAENATVDIQGGYITNNSQYYRCDVNGNGCHGGGGIATIGGSLDIKGGKITGNYSVEAGGGVYVGHYNAVADGKYKGAAFAMTSGIIAGNYAKDSEGGGLRISGYTTGKIEIEKNDKAYITNNETGTTYDWGGGGIFVQTEGYLNILKALITNNSAGGYGGGVGACPTGKTLLLHDDGAAIYENKADGVQMSKGGNGKTSDKDVAKPKFEVDKEKRYKDYFCVRSDDEANSHGEKENYISLVTGMMLGNGAAGWEGHCDDDDDIKISKTGYAAAKKLFGLNANPDDEAITAAENQATLIITGNKSGTHGGGIMTNGGLIIGKSSDVNATPDMSIFGTKALFFDSTRQTNGLDYYFAIYDSDGKELKKVQATEENGIFMIIPDVSGKNPSTGTCYYYLKEVNDNRSGITYDTSQYEIGVEIEKDSITILGTTFNSYYVNSVKIRKLNEKGELIKELVDSSDYVGIKNTDGSYTLQLKGDTFINYKYSYELPATGGTGTIKFTIGGLLIAAGSLWYGYSMKRRRERRAG